LIAHGTADRVISIDGGRRLFDSLPGDISKKWVVIPDAGHDNVLVTSYPIYADIAGWMLHHLADR
jgi:dipeptidyl aminopeptidase/acylaminoacyl peptidase